LGRFLIRLAVVVACYEEGSGQRGLGQGIAHICRTIANLIAFPAQG
jgi:hypothetical protein